jgi:hypothetical protein
VSAEKGMDNLFDLEDLLNKMVPSEN